MKFVQDISTLKKSSNSPIIGYQHHSYRLKMEIFSSGVVNIATPTQPTNISATPSEKTKSQNLLGVHVSISPEAREKHDAELKQAEQVSTDKKDFGASLRSDNSIINPSKTEKKALTLAEKLEQRIEEVKEKIIEVQQEIQTLRANGSELAEEKIKRLEQQLQALLGELNSLMQQKLELMKKGQS